ncbi:tubulin binding cofactor A [Pluteus cervinus]|uniref:Tubulin binding cofactor A n=1 Tax=Pluteus cervinus TaxID=181527 RepID=A0ACD3BHD3_9AGAR|nr:tubulin binding cofactor A [Pluteus cervinus]
MSDSEQIRILKRELKIKSGAAKRLAKEHKLYKKEAGDQQRKLDKLVADNADNVEEWDIKNARKMLDESNRMITDSATRLGKAAEELQSTVDSAKKHLELAEAEELLNADEILKDTTTA